MKYKVHIGYVNSNGDIVPAGIYEDTRIDVAEARARSILTLHDINLASEKPQEVDSVTVKKVALSAETPEFDVKEKEMTPIVGTFQVKRFLINSATSEEIQALKYVGKGTAQKVIEERNKEKFKSYVDLDTRVPLRLGKKWQDITFVDFETTVPMTVENAVSFI